MKRLSQIALAVVLCLSATAAWAVKTDINSASETSIYNAIGRGYKALGKRVGPTYGRTNAKKIVAGRPYKAVSDLKSRSIISKTLYKKIYNQLTAKAAPKPPSGKLDVNKASTTALTALIRSKGYSSRYSSSSARKIVAKRPYSSVSSLSSRKVISATLYRKIKGSLKGGSGSAPTPTPSPGKTLDVNSASTADLTALIRSKGYSASYSSRTAKKIVAKRPHRSVASLKSRKVVSARLYRKISGSLTAKAVTPTPTEPEEPSLPFRRSRDLTSRNSPARDQGRRGTCVAFSTLAGMEFHDKTLDLSEQDAFYKMRERASSKSTCLRTKYDAAKPKLCQDKRCYGTNLSTAVRALQGSGVLSESAWAYERYNNTEAGVNCHEMITWASKKPSYYGKKLVKLGSVTWLARPKGYPSSKRVDDPMVLMAIMDRGWAVNITIGVAGSGWRSGRKIDVEIDPTTKKPVKIRGGHGLLLVGYDYDKGLLKFKNSWGSGWGSKGYGWMTFDYLKTYVTGGYYAKSIRK